MNIGDTGRQQESKSFSQHMRQWVWSALIFLALAVVTVVIPKLFSQAVVAPKVKEWLAPSEKSDIGAHLRQLMNQMNSELPMMIDSETRCDTTMYAEGTFRYIYTLINVSAEDIVPFVSDQEWEVQGTDIRNRVCTTPELQFFVTNNIAVEYFYRGKHGKHIKTFTVAPSQCDENP
ncbi:MAG: hypothetical protein OXC18_18510 [Desulfurellaceae bacterium]|nr:hypothetical protein [Desulfurellaceae bacterium]